MNVLLVLGHPRKDSLNAALAGAFAAGAAAAGVTLRRLDLADLDFNPNVTVPSPRDQPLEADLARAQELIRWADHVVFVYPTWWGTLPALLKGFLDRVLTPGFAFAERREGGWEPLLAGKTAQLLTTMDTPPWVYRWIYRQPGHNALRRATLGFCGVRTVRVTVFAPVKDADAARRAEWLEIARREGQRLAGGALSPGQRLGDKLGAWRRAVRLQFYPMTWVAYTIGALAAGGALDPHAYLLGYGFLFFLEVATVLSNEYFDYASDRLNRHYGPFTGGSRVLVEGLLSFREVRAGGGLALGLALALAAAALHAAPRPWTDDLGVLLVMTVLALGYTTPPLQLVYRGLGELDVGLTHSIGVLLCGHVLQGGDWRAPLPWLLSLPLFLSILPAIILAGIPDYAADRAVAKRTLAVLLGPRRAVIAAIIATLAAAAAGMILLHLNLLDDATGALWLLTLPHAALIAWLLARRLPRLNAPQRIDGLMAAALTFSVWYGAVPLYHLA
ncbi:MAG: NAD(P)H-dependent oxidoreductase [Pseudomonadota bacterium]|nr:NAD(P)H-dependent oxidoreductase [Pseudomonadota bacterium]